MTDSLRRYGHIHSVEPFGVFDGPGIRHVVFMQGCLMRCAYCHNPDTWGTGEAGHGELRNVTQLVESISRYREYYTSSGGGLTVSGGEPLLQAQFVEALFRSTKSELGLSTALDTAGVFGRTSTPASVSDLLRATDLLLLDIKSTLPDKHLELTGWSLDYPLSLLAAAEALSVPTILRRVLVPDLTDSDEDLIQLRNLAKGHSNAIAIEILPYHTMGRAKWEAQNLQYRLANYREPSGEELERARLLTVIGRSG